MKLKEKYTLEIGRIESLIDDLKNGLVYEKEQLAGTPTCYTLGTKLENAFCDLMQKLESDTEGGIETAARQLQNTETP